MAPSAQAHPSEYNYNRLCDQQAEVMKESVCYCLEWYEEKLPLCNKEGTEMDQLIQSFIDNSAHNDPFLEFVKPETEKPPKVNEFDKVEPPKKEKVLVFTDSHGYCDGIIKHAPEGRISSKTVVTGTDYDQEAVDKLLSKKWDFVIFGSPLDYDKDMCAADVIEQNGAISKLFFHICKHMQANNKNVKRIAILCRGTFADEEDQHREVGLGMCCGGTMFGHCRTARMEFANDGDIPMQWIDTEYHKDLPEWMEEDTYILERLSAECFRMASFGHNDVRILHRGRFVLRQVPSDDYEKAGWEFEIPDHGVIGIAGGNGALGLIMGFWLINQAEKQKKSGFKIQFLSRSCKIAEGGNAKQWKKIQEKAAKLGIEVSQDKMDMSSQDGVDDYIQSCNGQLRGFIHSAGVLQDQMLGKMTWEQVEQVFDPKHRAALYLHESLLKYQNPELLFLWMFSSIAAYGNMGQWNYSGSNSFLDSLCRHRKALGLPACAMQWGGWGEVGMAVNMDAQSRRRMEQSIMPAFPTKDGLKGMEAGLQTGLPGFSVFRYNPEAMFSAFDDCDTANGCFQRNFVAEICPSPPTFKWLRKHQMTIFRLSHGSYGDLGQNLIWDKWVLPYCDMEDEEEEDPDESTHLWTYPGNHGNTSCHY